MCRVLQRFVQLWHGQLVELNLAETIGERGGRQYQLDPRWRSPFPSDGLKVTASKPIPPAAQHTLPDLVGAGAVEPPHLSVVTR